MTKDKKTVQNGKGSRPRPTDKDKYDKHYEGIYGKKEVKK